MAYEIGFGDEVIVPSYTFAATASAYHRNGARVVFADINPETLMVDPRDIEERITPRTKAIVPVHYAGFSAQMEEIASICEENNLILIEDAAQGLCSTGMGSRWLGSIGSLGCISFHETKIIHSGLGGALFVNEDGLFDRIEEIWERGTNRTKMFKGLVDKYSWVEPGSSFYPSELQAAFLLAQLESIDDNLSWRKELTGSYLEKLAPLQSNGLIKMQTNDDSEKWNSHAMVIILDSSETCDGLRVFLKERGVNAYIGYVPLHSSKMGLSLGWQPQDLPITEEYAHRVLRLPLHHEMSVDDISRVCSEIEAFMDANA
jgi:dTDP-4-amino-4,6-dideoxygalactose transaminase